ncbi:hypothetical protein GCM10019059_07390 [Camelimonas fluminis]|nr:hypothetical protein GCM10019059_07390 [Camelimonas fluminis]
MSNTSLSGDAVKEVAALVKTGALTVTNITPPLGSHGLPPSIPVGITNGDKPEAVSLKPLIDQWRQRPERKTGQAKVLTLASFVDLTNRHKTRNTAIFADSNWRAPSLTAIVDYHEANVSGVEDTGAAAPIADNGKHRIHYAFPLSEEWQVWVDQDGVKMGQADFAAFIEDHIAELASPTPEETSRMQEMFATTVASPAKLVELSRGLQINVDSKIKNHSTLQSGEIQMQFEETHTGGDGQPIKVPGMFILSISPFFRGEVLRIPVRLRYRAASGSIVWFFQMFRPDQYVTERVVKDLARAAEQTGLPAYEGAPEMSA